MGTHAGYTHFTIGQRRGLGIAAAQPLYVLKIVPEKNQVVVGTESELASQRFEAARVNWLSIPEPAGPVRAVVKIRSRHEGGDATVTPRPDAQAQVAFDGPQSAITPGQAAVFYDGDLVLGGGWIAADA